tara:strand:- start:65795 stop:67051 length:1257 start_codon:yes stop_codon:yes gene_type:complete
MLDKRLSTAVLACACVLLNPAAKADLIDDSKLNVELRNFYMNRDFRHDNGPGKTPQSRQESWSQAVYARYTSGYTEGTIGFGVDVAGFYALKLDGGAGTGGDGNMSLNPGEQASDISRAGATLKTRYSNSTLKLGLLEPRLPVIFADDARLLPQTFQGVMLESEELKGFKFTAGQLWNTSTRASSDQEPFYLALGPATNPKNNSNDLSFAGVDATLSDHFSASYYYAQLEDIYEQHYVGGNMRLPLGEKTNLLGTLSYFDNGEQGKEHYGKIDNRAYGLRLGVQHGSHTLTAAYQRMLGDSMFPMLHGGTPQPYLVNWVTNGGFFFAQERSYQLRYDLNFAALGVPGLSLMSRYIKGTAIKRSAGDGHEYERDTDVRYVVQSGSLKDLSLLLRTSTVRSSYGNDYDEVRFITSYPFSF